MKNCDGRNRVTKNTLKHVIAAGLTLSIFSAAYISARAVTTFYDENFDDYSVGAVVAQGSSTNENHDGFRFVCYSAAYNKAGINAVQMSEHGVALRLFNTKDYSTGVMPRVEFTREECADKLYVSFDVMFAESTTIICFESEDDEIDFGMSDFDELDTDVWYNITISSGAAASETELCVYSDGEPIVDVTYDVLLDRLYAVTSENTKTDFYMDNLLVRDASGEVSPDESPVPTIEPSPSASPVPTIAPSPSASPAPTIVPSPSASPAPTIEPLPSASPAPTIAPSPSASPVPTVAPSPTATAVSTPSPSESPAPTAGPSSSMPYTITQLKILDANKKTLDAIPKEGESTDYYVCVDIASSRETHIPSTTMIAGYAKDGTLQYVRELYSENGAGEYLINIRNIYETENIKAFVFDNTVSITPLAECKSFSDTE